MRVLTYPKNELKWVPGLDPRFGSWLEKITLAIKKERPKYLHLNDMTNL